MEQPQAPEMEEQTTTAPQRPDEGPKEKTGAQDHMAKRGSRRGRGNMAFAGSPQDKYCADLAVQQIEYLFSVENLCRDTYLRSYMDAEGYVPIAMVCNFPLVATYGASYPEIMARLEKSESLELHHGNETLRPLDKPQQWVFPTPAPMWIKLAPAPDQADGDQQQQYRRPQGQGQQGGRPYNNNYRGNQYNGNNSNYHHQKNNNRGKFNRARNADGSYKQQEGGVQRQGGIRGNAATPQVDTAPPPLTATEFPPLSASVC